MRIRELAEKCKDREMNCDGCTYTDVCKKLEETLEDISPIGLIDLVDDNEIIY